MTHCNSPCNLTNIQAIVAYSGLWKNHAPEQTQVLERATCLNCFVVAFGRKIVVPGVSRALSTKSWQFGEPGHTA